ncbi:hypothetical protein BH24DEI2_BH24DEI2_20400 [soil metagenome]
MFKVGFFGLLVAVLSGAGFGLGQSGLPVGAVQRAPERYTDVAPTHWAYEALQQVTAQGIFTGYPDGTFGGTKGLSRYEAAIIAARLVDYLDSLVNVLSGDETFMDSLRQAATELGPVSDMGERVVRLEAGMEEAASVAYVKALEGRLIAVEAELNTALGRQAFPATPIDPNEVPLTAAEALAASGAAGDVAATSSQIGENDTPAVTFLSESAHPFYVGFAPGVVSTSGDVYFGAQVGYDALLGPVGVVARFVLNSGANELRVSADATVRLRAFDENLSLYGGIGPGFSFRPGGSAALLEIPFGFEYLLSSRVGLYGQLTTSYAFAPLNHVDAVLTAGVNLRF